MVENHFKTVKFTDFQDSNESAIASPYWQSIQGILPRITDVKLNLSFPTPKNTAYKRLPT